MSGEQKRGRIEKSSINRQEKEKERYVLCERMERPAQVNAVGSHNLI
jgi:hypothetical protein